MIEFYSKAAVCEYSTSKNQHFLCYLNALTAQCLSNLKTIHRAHCHDGRLDILIIYKGESSVAPSVFVYSDSRADEGAKGRKVP